MTGDIAMGGMQMVTGLGTAAQPGDAVLQKQY